MATKIYKTGVVELTGFQAILKPSEYGYTLETTTDDPALVEELDADREGLLETQKAKLKNPKRATQRPEPWEEVASGVYKLKFGWDAKEKPTIVDSEGTLITNQDLPLYSGSKVRIAFYQKGYTLKDGVTYGTSIKLSGIQVIELGSSSSRASLSEAQAAELFGSHDGGFTVDDIPPAGTTDDGDEPAEEEDGEF